MTSAVHAPYLDDLYRGQVFDGAPAVTLTEGMAAQHQAIVGDRLRLALDAHLAAQVTGRDTALAHPGLVCDIAIGQSTLATQRVKANLFYRNLQLLRHPHIGDTLTTTTTVVGLRDNSIKPGRPATGLVALHIRTQDQNKQNILDFYRCAMLPLNPNRGPEADRVQRADDLSSIGMSGAEETLPTWDLARFSDVVAGQHFTERLAGREFQSSGDVVSSAPELARLTLNVAATHHDARHAPRLVYGGHTIGVAFAQACRVLPNVVTMLGWRSCDHTAPVSEDDTLTSVIRVESARALPNGGGILDLRSLVTSHPPGASDGAQQVLDWEFSVLMA